jgi:hypothetical protein
MIYYYWWSQQDKDKIHQLAGIYLTTTMRGRNGTNAMSSPTYTMLNLKLPINSI